MTISRPLTLPAIVASTLILAILFFVACAQSQPPSPPPPAPAEKVFLVFEGPWAVAPDPNDAGKVLLIAPKTKSHHDLYVAASNNVTLPAGVYELSVPVSGTAGTPTTPTDMAQAKTTPDDLKRVLNTKSDRYVIRLPKPEAYLAATRFRSRVGPTYPPDASTEKEYVSAVSLRYNVGSLSGFSLSGTPDSGSFKPTQLQVEAGTVSFVIDPVQAFDPTERCHAHSREAFRDLTRLLKLTLYIDFPDSPSSCHDTDPQKSKAALNTVPTRMERLRALLEGNEDQVQRASVLGANPAFLLFGYHAPICTGAVLLLTTS